MQTSLDEFENVLKLIDGEVKNRKEDISIEQLNFAKNEVLKIIQFLRTRSLPEKLKRDSGVIRMVADSWPIKSEISEKLIVALSKYKNIT